MTSFNTTTRLTFALLLSVGSHLCGAFSDVYTKTITLDSVSARRTGILDGAELNALDSFLSHDDENRNTQRMHNEANIGKLNFVVGKMLENGVNRRVVGMECPSTRNTILRSSMAIIPETVSDADAISTALASLVGVHCCIPKLNDVGGSKPVDGSDFVVGKAVILGGGAYARFCADALEKLGADVTLVTTGKSRLKNTRVNVLPPMVGESELGFASALGDFDIFLDTLYDENNVGEGPFQMGSGIVELLKRLHNCERYVSTYSNAQKLISDEGVIWGPGKVKEYTQGIKKQLSTYRDVAVPQGFGQSTLQILLNEGVTYSAQKKGDEPIVRGWSLEDFWENTSWPRDSTGAINIRFGLPVIDDIENTFEEEDNDDEEEIILFDEKKESLMPANPFVKDIQGIEGLQNNILSTKSDCVLFLSAPFCRTCKILTPQFTRMARIAAEEHDGAITFAKADAMGKIGKDLGKRLQVETVPTFIMFRGGERYGSPLVITKLPSKKMNTALDLLSSGMEWDSKFIREL